VLSADGPGSLGRGARSRALPRNARSAKITNISLGNPRGGVRTPLIYSRREIK
jgi:hypothetical protein